MLSLFTCAESVESSEAMVLYSAASLYQLNIGFKVYCLESRLPSEDCNRYLESALEMGI